MSRYKLNRNKQDSKSGEKYELHNEESCNRLPIPINRLPVGYFPNCHDAKKAAKAKYHHMASDIDGCYFCCPECHNE